MGESYDNYDNVLPYGDELVVAKSQTVEKDHIEALDNYIVEEILLSGKDAIPVLTKVKKQKCDANNIPIGDANPNPILDTCIYEL